MPVVDPNHQSHDEPHPDPDAVDQLAQKWLDMAARLHEVAAKIPEAVNAVDWTGDGREAAFTAAGKVAGIVNQTADSCTTLGNGLKQYADELRKALAAEKAAMIAEIVGIVLTIGTFFIGGILTAAIARLASLIANVLSKLGSILGLSGDLAGFSAFAAGSLVFGGLTAGIDVISQLIGAAAAGSDIHIDPAMVVADAFLGGVAGGLGAIDDPAMVNAAHNSGRPGGGSVPNPHSDVPNPNGTHLGDPNHVSGGLQSVGKPPPIEFTGGRPTPGDMPHGNPTFGDVRTPAPAPSHAEPFPTGTNGVRTPASVEGPTSVPRPGNAFGDSVSVVRPPSAPGRVDLDSGPTFPGRGNVLGDGPVDGSSPYVAQNATHPVPTTRTPTTGPGEPPTRITPTRTGPGYDEPATISNPPRNPSEPNNGAPTLFPGRGSRLDHGPTPDSTLYVNQNATLRDAVSTNRPPTNGANAGQPPTRVTPTRTGPGYDEPATLASPPRQPAEPHTTTVPFSGKGTQLDHGPTPTNTEYLQQNATHSDAVLSARPPRTEPSAGQPPTTPPTRTGRGYDYPATMDHTPTGPAEPSRGTTSTRPIGSTTQTQLEPARGATNKPPTTEPPTSFPGKGSQLDHGPTPDSTEYVGQNSTLREAVLGNRPPTNNANAGHPPARVTPTRTGPGYDEPATLTSPPRQPAEPTPTTGPFSGRGTTLDHGPTPDSTEYVQQNATHRDAAPANRPPRTEPPTPTPATSPTRTGRGYDYPATMDNAAHASNPPQRGTTSTRPTGFTTQTQLEPAGGAANKPPTTEPEPPATFPGKGAQLDHGPTPDNTEYLDQNATHRDAVATNPNRPPTNPAHAGEPPTRTPAGADGQADAPKRGLVAALRSKLGRSPRLDTMPPTVQADPTRAAVADDAAAEPAPVGRAAGSTPLDNPHSVRVPDRPSVTDTAPPAARSAGYPSFPRPAGHDGVGSQASASALAQERYTHEQRIDEYRRGVAAHNDASWAAQEPAWQAEREASVTALSRGLDPGLRIIVRDTAITLYQGAQPAITVPASRPPDRTTVIVDATVSDPTAIRRFLDGLPPERTRALTVEITQLPAPITPAQATALANQLLAGQTGQVAVVIPADALTIRPPQSPHQVPVDAESRITQPALAQHYYLHPSGQPEPGSDDDRLVAVDALGRVTFPAFAHAYQAFSGAVPTPYNLAPAGQPGAYQLADGWVVRPSGAGIWLAPTTVDGHVGPEPARQPVIVLGVPGVDVPTSVNAQLVEILAGLPDVPVRVAGAPDQAGRPASQSTVDGLPVRRGPDGPTEPRLVEPNEVTRRRGSDRLPTSDDVVILGGRYDLTTDRMLLDGQWRDATAVADWIRRWTPWSAAAPLPIALVASYAGDFGSRIAQQLGDAFVLATPGQVIELPDGQLFAGASLDADGRLAPDTDGVNGWHLYTSEDWSVPAGSELLTILTDNGSVVAPPRSGPERPLLWAHLQPLPIVDTTASAVRLSSPRDTVAHDQAAAAVPRAAGWQTLIAHLKDGRVFDGDGSVDGPQLVERLDLTDGGFAGVVMVVCDAATGEAGQVAAAADLHRATGNRMPVLAPTHKTASADGDVWSAIWTVDDNHQVQPQFVGSWVLWQDGRPRDLGTPSLTAALAQLDVPAIAGGPAPDEPVSFFNDLTAPQQARLRVLGYDAGVLDHSPDSFYLALISVAGHLIAPVLSAQRTATATPDNVRAAVVAAVTADLAHGAPRYRHLLPSSGSHDQLLTDLATPTVWNHAAAVLVPHVAADIFGLELGVLGQLGIAEAVGDPFGLRRGDASGDPFIVVNVGDQFLPAIPVPGAQQGPRELSPRPDGTTSATAWTRPLTQPESDLVAQAGADPALTPQAQAEARATMEWQIRQNDALARIELDHSYSLPAGFGEEHQGRRQYPMGRDGQFVRLGAARLNDFEAVAQLVVDGYRTDHRGHVEGLREDLRRQLLERLFRDGSEAVVRRWLEGGLEFHISAGAGNRPVRETVRVRLELGDPSLARQATSRATERGPIGQKDHIAVEADHESTSGVGFSTAANRGLGVNASVAVGFGGVPNALFSAQGGIGASGSGTHQSSGGNDAVSASKRLFEFGGERGYFDFLGASLTVRTILGRRNVAEPGTRQRLVVRASFASERLPARQPQASVWPDPAGPTFIGDLLGLDPDDVQPDALARVAAVQHRVFNIAESVSGLENLRIRVATELHRGI
jgi:hypothetical protein